MVTHTQNVLLYHHPQSRVGTHFTNILADTHSMEPIVHCLQTLPEDPYLSLRINSIKHSLSLLTMCTWELSALKL